MGCTDDDDPLELDGLTMAGERVVGVTLDRPELTDVELSDCDLSGVVLTAYVVRRAKLARTRIRDCVWGGGLVQDVSFAECPTSSLSMRMATLQRVSFVDCDLSGADFYGATFDQVRFEGCNLERAAFDTATVKAMELTRCELAGVTGALALAGAVMDMDDLAALAPSLAREVGIRLRTDG